MLHCQRHFALIYDFVNSTTANMQFLKFRIPVLFRYPWLKPQPNLAESLNLQTNVAEKSAQIPPTAQLPPIPSEALTSVLTCPPLTPAPRHCKSLKIKQLTSVSNLSSPPPLTPAPELLSNDPKPPRKAETTKKWREVDKNEIIHKLDPDLERFMRLN